MNERNSQQNEGYTYTYFKRCDVIQRELEKERKKESILEEKIVLIILRMSIIKNGFHRLESYSQEMETKLKWE